jgi:hypothetical protein
MGCEPAVLPPPSIVSVEPERIAEGGPSVLTVQVSAVLPVEVNYGSETVEAAQLGMTLRIAGQQADIAFAEDNGKLVAAVPQGLTQGAYDVAVVLADGREAVREQAFSVVPPAALEPGDGVVRGGLTGYQIDPVGEQFVGVPFTITIRALGPGASSFQGMATLRASKSKQVPLLTGAFTGGVRLEALSLDQPGDDIFLMIEDALGNKGLSNSFKVRQL